MRKSTSISALCLLLLSSSGQAVRPPVADEEAGDTTLQRDGYFASRRVNPYDSNFDATQARIKAYQQFRSAIDADKNNPAAMAALAAPLHYEVWQSIGPAPIVSGQTPTSATAASRSNVAGRVSAIAIDGIDNAVYIGGAQGGVWRSLDHGASWVALTDYLGSLAVGSIAIAPGAHSINQGTIFLGTGEANLSGDSYAGIGIYKSTDSGQTWQGPYGQAQFAKRSVAAIVVDRSNPLIVLAGTTSGILGIGASTPPAPRPARGIFRSTDGGLTWPAAPATLSSGGLVSRMVQDPNPALTGATSRFWAATLPLASGGALQRSDDDGQTWNAVDGVASGLPAIASNLRTWVTTTYDTTLNKTVLYFGADSNTGGILYKSVDGGTTWTHLAAAEGYCQGQCFYDEPLYAEPGNGNILYTGGAGTSGTLPSSFMRSTNGGTSFTDQMVGVDGKSALHADMHDITSWPGSPNEVWVGNDGGVFYSTDRGLHWINANTNQQLTQFSACDLHPTDPNQAYGGTQDNGTDSFLGSSAWSHSDDGDGGFSLINQTTPNLVTHTYFNQSNNQIAASIALNGPASVPNDYQYYVGENPGFITSGMDPSDPVLFYAPMHLDRGHQTTLYFGTNHLYIAPDFFNQTITQEDALTGNPPYTVNIFSPLATNNMDFAAAIPPLTAAGAISAIETETNILPNTNANTLFVGTSNGNVWRSTDSGLTFTSVDGTIGQYVSQIAVYPRNPQIVFQARAGFTGALPAHNVRKSIDGGTTWADASNGLPDIPVNSLVWDPAFPGQVWAGTDIGMYLSTDEGATWHPYNNGMPNVAVFSLAANRLTHTVLACTHGRGAFRLNLDAIFIDGFDGN